MKNNKGFTLIEMLVVIAIIAILVAVVVPTVTASTSKAKAAADGANLRSSLGLLNVQMITQANSQDALDVSGVQIPSSKTFPDASIEVLYCPSHFVYIYYKSGGVYYGADYFSELAETGVAPAAPSLPDTTGMNVQWYTIQAN